MDPSEDEVNWSVTTARSTDQSMQYLKQNNQTKKKYLKQNFLVLLTSQAKLQKGLEEMRRKII